MDCFSCGYLQERKDEDGNVEYYCNDLDEVIDPFERICSDENYES